MNALIKLFNVIILLLCFASNLAFGWKITKELKKELKQKLKAVEENKNSPYAHFDLAITYAYTNYVQEGWDELKEVHKLDPDFALEALRIYGKAALENPDDWRLRYRLAFAFYFNDYKKRAIEELKEVLRIDPKNVFAYGYIGLIYGEMDKVDEGIKWIKKGLKIVNNVAALHLLLASAYYKKGESWKGFWEGVEALRLKALGY